jgi:uncharacterized protein (TIGR02757 family)
MSSLSPSDLKDFLDEKVIEYNTPKFIEADPIQIPHRYSKKEDIEIMSLLLSTIAWGNRKSIITNGERLIQLMGNNPHEFVLNYKTPEDGYIPFVHRTFNSLDLDFFFRSLQKIYAEGTLEQLFTPHAEVAGVKGRIANFRTAFLDIEHEKRSEKHLSNPLKGASAKRLNMFLRWMVRKDNCGVDFGLWDSIPMSELYLPLDVHTGNIARKLGMLSRTQNDWAALEEIQSALCALDPHDPVKYDFALFGLGAYEAF